MHARLDSLGGSVSDVFGALRLRTWRGTNESKSGNRVTTWTRGLVAGLGAVAMAAAMSVAGPQEAKASMTE